MEKIFCFQFSLGLHFLDLSLPAFKFILLAQPKVVCLKPSHPASIYTLHPVGYYIFSILMNYSGIEILILGEKVIYIWSLYKVTGLCDLWAKEG